MALLRRIADQQLRAENARLAHSRDQARSAAKSLFRRLLNERHATATQAALTGRWRAIATDRAEELRTLKEQQ